MKKFKHGLFVLVLVTVLLSGCTAKQATAANPDDKTSGTITIYTSQPEQDIQALIAAFNKTYPNVTVNYFRSGTEEVISKVKAEKQAGALQADLLLVSDDATFESLKSSDLLLSYASKELTGIDKKFYDADHTYTGTKIISTGIMINTNSVTGTQIKGLADLTESAYKDSLIMPSPLYSGAAAYNLGILTRTTGLGWDFYQSLKTNNIAIVQGNGGVSTAIIAGQKKAGIVVDYLALRAKNSGSPVDFIYPSEGSLIVTEPIGILKGTKNEALAKLFVDYILSVEGQTETATIGYTPIKEGVAAPAGFKSVKDITVLTTDLNTLVTNREADKAKFSTIFQ